MCQSLVNKNNIPGPRYTSYPTVPYWDNETFSLGEYKNTVRQSYIESNRSEGLSVYIHLPYCESLCTFCGCNKRITKRHEVELPYINTLLKEWDLYLKFFATKPRIKELHLGGGTPTFFSPENLEYLIKGILRTATLADDFEFSFEGHPGNTTKLHLQTLYDLGFRRVSFGVQDYNEKVQNAIHRTQTFEQVQQVTQLAREIGYTSVGHDIIFGLPFQTQEDVRHTILKTKELMPDRLAFYSYAHVPWQKGNGQRGFKDSDLPAPADKRAQYELGKALLASVGYVEVGMDHFALVTDALYQSMENKSLHRNFMGYTASKTQLMVGLGVSAIGDSWYGFAQNVKGIEEYKHLVNEQILPVFRGHLLTEVDESVRQHILDLMCRMQTRWDEGTLKIQNLDEVLERLAPLQNDGLLELDTEGITILEKGKPFVRNICMAFDLRLQAHQPKTQLFSMTV
ncbi:oxygen-independent coproporphyrinogen III oxidase [Aquimarina intermedia]|uniref:Coproporphyrinogen-III oxidase n=1 Tax=Aquimarina intermedia TaxID=350814 RepID=A0A5S5C7A2_9FLAO|nr:oxygen-independent coproporphyrinogen III oxidase [Aquimarina intermedia]TYP74276.1 oxygen-independent coproporphyrinogen-3 oxidase [Aquimarina intermedia]